MMREATIFRRGPLECGSLGFACDDKVEGGVLLERDEWDEQQAPSLRSVEKEKNISTRGS